MTRSRSLADSNGLIGPATISGLGIVLFLIELQHATRMETTVGIVLEAGVPLLLACLLIYGGIWLERSDFGGESIARIVCWVGVGVSIMLLVTVWVISHQLIRSGDFHHTYFVMTNTAIVGGLGGFVVGAYDARGERRRLSLAEERRKLTTERERMVFLNQLLRHTVLNEMNVVLGRSQSLAGHVDADGAPHLRAITHSSEDVVSLIRKVRTLTAALSRPADESLEATDLSELLDSAVESPQITHGFARVTIDVPNGVTVSADDLLSEVFENLLLNAVVHHDGDAPIVAIDAAFVDGGSSVVVTVADDGPGIPADEKADLFDESVNDLAGSGHGIGLVLVRALVTRYGGDVWVEDNDPRGTVVSVVLPVADRGTNTPVDASPSKDVTVGSSHRA